MTTLLSACSIAALSAFCNGQFSTPVRSITVSPSLAKTQNHAVTTTTFKDLPQASLSKSDNWDEQWNQLLVLPDSQATEQRMKELIEKMAEDDPLLALARVQGVGNLKLRGELLRSALQGWGRTSPDTAISLAAQLMQSDPDHTQEYGQDLVSALAQSGHFASAASFAATGTGEAGSSWLTTAYSKWAEHQPQAALAQVRQLTNPYQQQAAMDAIISGWAPTDPKGMAEYAMQSLPQGYERSLAISEALRFWAVRDTAGAQDWMNHYDPSPELDMGEAAVATLPEAMQQPLVALGWAESITDPDLRSRTEASVVETWAARDPAAAMRYAKNSPGLNSNDRTALLAKFNSSP